MGILEDERNAHGFELTPNVLTFGCICQGFVYHLPFTLTNTGLRPRRIHVTCYAFESGEKNRLKCLFEAKNIAPGMPIKLVLQLAAHHLTSCTFQIKVTISDVDEAIVRNVDAQILAVDIFKNFSKSLQLQKKPIYKNGVTPVATTQMPADDKSISSFCGAGMGASAITENVMSEALMDFDDIEDLLDLPKLTSVYWDPKDNVLKVDRQLGEVYVNPDLSIQEAVKETNRMWDMRLRELEDMGFYTIRSLRKMEDGLTTHDNSTLLEQEGTVATNGLQ